MVKQGEADKLLRTAHYKYFFKPWKACSSETTSIPRKKSIFQLDKVNDRYILDYLSIKA